MHELRSSPNATDTGLSIASCGPYDVRASIQQETLMAAVLSSRDTQSVRSAWRGFNAGTWTTRVDVRDFIQKNYTPYEGDERFLASEIFKARRAIMKAFVYQGPGQMATTDA
jgi:hypothetical protein